MSSSLWRQAIRLLWTRKAFAAAAIGSLGLAIGAVTTVFAAVDAVLLRPLPFANADRVVVISEYTPTADNGLVAPLTFAVWRDHASLLDHVGAFTWWESSRILVDSLEQPITRIRATSDYFAVLGAHPFIGRTLQPRRPGGGPEAVLSYDTWQRWFKADPGVIGQLVRVDNVGFTVVGVMPPAHNDMRIGWGDVWTLMNVDERAERSRPVPFRFLRVIGSVRGGASLEQTRQQLSALQSNLLREIPVLGADYRARAVPLKDSVVGWAKPALTTLLGAVVFVLLTACANVASLYLARLIERERELATRLALGASFRHLVTLLMAESTLLAILGGAVGVLLASLAVRLLRLTSAYLPRAGEIALTWQTLFVTAGAVVVTALVIGTMPILWLRRIRISERLQESTRTGSASLRQSWMRNSLLFAQIAVTVVLMIAAGELVRSTMTLMQVDPGFRARQAVMFDISVFGAPYDNRDRLGTFYRNLQMRLQEIPGVKAAGTIRYFPYRPRLETSPVFVVGAPAAHGAEPVVHWNLVSGSYFDAMGIRVVRGRAFTDREMWDSGDAVVINETMARRVFAGRDPLDHAIRESESGPDLRVVGIVEDVRQRGLDASSEPEMYVPYASLKEELTGIATVVLRTDPTAQISAAMVREQLQKVDSRLVAVNLGRLDDYVRETLSNRRFIVFVLAAFAALALALAATGVYGMLSYVVNARVPEIGIRMAIGAHRTSILMLVISQGLKIAILGCIGGAIGALGMARIVGAYVVGMTAFDAITYAAVMATLLAVVLVAAGLPAARAARVDPLEALRSR